MYNVIEFSFTHSTNFSIFYGIKVLNFYLFPFSFRIDNTDHIIDVNQGRSWMEYDQVNILCPLYDKKTTPNIQDTERYVIYHVNKEEYDMCRIMTAHPHVIASCEKPYNLSYFTISFRVFSPTPGALEFHAGKDYYFISTSSKDDLYLRAGGMCRTHNVKLVFKVADGSKNVNKQLTSADVPVKPLKDNQSAIPPSHHQNNALDENSASTVVEEKKERRRKRKKDRRNKTVLPVAPSHGSELSVMNDNPKFRQKEPSRVEKVNNLMKQEASPSIFAGGSGAAGLSGLTSEWRLILLLLPSLLALKINNIILFQH